MKDKLKLVFIGHGRCGKLGLETIRTKFLDKLDIVYIIDHPNSDVPGAVSKLATEMNIPHYNGSTDNIRQTIAQLKPDFGIIMRHPQLIKPDFFNQFKLGVFNIHPSDLPKYRGDAPLEFTIVNGDPLIVTSFKIDEGMDTGDILLKTKSVNISGKDLGEVFSITINETNRAMEQTINKILAGEIKLTPQAGLEIKPSTALKENIPELLKINSEDDSDLIHRKMLAKGDKNDK
jgi:methionyl-tRNA formyltransferase